MFYTQCLMNRDCVESVGEMEVVADYLQLVHLRGILRQGHGGCCCQSKLMHYCRLTE